MNGAPLPATSPVGVVGAGAMGAGIAQVAARAGHTVHLYDEAGGAVDAAREQISARLDKSVSKGRMTSSEARAAVGRIHAAGRLADLSGAGLVIEAVVEDQKVKQDVLARVESLVGAETLLATNTSSLSITALATALDDPTRLAGMHFFNPAPVLPLVEIVSGHLTDPQVAAACFATAAAWGKKPVHCKSTPGFIVNRVARPFYGEALRLLYEGAADPATIDHIVEGAGRFRMGPFTLMDLVGLDVNFAVSQSVYRQTFHDPRFAPSPIQRSLVDAGRLGRKSGAGFFDYEEGAAIPEPVVVAARPLEGPVTVSGDLRWAGALLDRFRRESVAVEFESGPDPGWIGAGGVAIYPTDGRAATSLVADGTSDTSAVVVLDLIRPDSTRAAIAVADQAEPDVPEVAAGVLQAAGIEASVVDDTPGLVLMRIVAQLASVAADAALASIALPHDIDTAMKLGTSYPLGPLEWADELGAGVVVEVLDHLVAHYGEERYRASPALRRAALTGRTLSEQGASDA